MRSRRASTPDTLARDLDPEERKAHYDAIFTGVTPPFAFVDLDAMRANARRCSLRPRAADPHRLQVRALDRGAAADPRARPRLSGRARLHRAGGASPRRAGFEDIVVAYPTVDRGAIAEVARLTASDPARAPVLMVDDRPHLDLIEGSIGGGRRTCASASTSTRAGGRLAGGWRGSGRSARRCTSRAGRRRWRWRSPSAPEPSSPG